MMRRTFWAEYGDSPEKEYFVLENGGISFFVTCARLRRRDARVAEEARLESVYTPKAYRVRIPSLR